MVGNLIVCRLSVLPTIHAVLALVLVQSVYTREHSALVTFSSNEAALETIRINGDYGADVPIED